MPWPKGKPRSEETKAKISKNSGMHRPDVVAKVHTPETHAKISAGRKGKGMGERNAMANPEARAKQLANVPRRPEVSGSNHPQWKGDAVGPIGAHWWLRENFPKAGQCDECGTKEKPTEYAFKYHPKPHTRNREDYRELCCSCHVKETWALRKKGIL